VSGDLSTAPLDKVSNSDNTFTAFKEVVFVPEHLELMHSGSHFGTEGDW